MFVFRCCNFHFKSDEDVFMCFDVSLSMSSSFWGMMMVALLKIVLNKA